jgi:hypothetical protein
MHRHLYLVAARAAAQKPRPAKVVQLEVRRQARLERAPKLPQLPTRPAA